MLKTKRTQSKIQNLTFKISGLRSEQYLKEKRQK